MADSTTRPTSSSEYSGSQAPEIQDSARSREHDYRAIPGGHPSRATAALGMESVDLDENASANAGHLTGVHEHDGDERMP